MKKAYLYATIKSGYDHALVMQLEIVKEEYMAVKENKAVVDALMHVLADCYALYLKTHNYHWNVTGPNFKSLHDLFEEQYTDLFTAVDEVAERVRTLGAKVPATFKTFASLTHIKDGDEKAKANDMVKQLYKDQLQIIECINDAMAKAHKAGDEGTIALLSSRIEIHEKNAWMLKASCE